MQNGLIHTFEDDWRIATEDEEVYVAIALIGSGTFCDLARENMAMKMTSSQGTIDVGIFGRLKRE